MTRTSGFLKAGMLGAALALGGFTISTPALAAHGGGGGGGFHGGGGGGFHGGGGGFHGGGGFGHGGFGHGGFGHGGFGGGYYGGGFGFYPGYAWGWGGPYDDYGYYDDGYPNCSLRRVHVHTAYGWRWRTYQYC